MAIAVGVFLPIASFLQKVKFGIFESLLYNRLQGSLNELERRKNDIYGARIVRCYRVHWIYGNS
jgi:hypothetical protein